MADRVPPIARIGLARSTGRLLLLPLVAVLIGALFVAIGVLGPVPGVVDAAQIAAMVVGGVAATFGLWVAARRLSVRLEVEESAVRVRWLGGARTYALTPGPVTRVRLRGDDASKLRLRGGPLRFGLGPALLRDEEEIEVVRLAPTPTGILVPTERGRLLIGASSEDALLDALSRAARARQRLDDLAVTAPPPPADGGREMPDDEPQPHVLTGIERAKLEERLRADRVALAAAPPTVMTPVPAPVPAPEPPPRPTVRLRRWRRDGSAPVRVRRPRPSAIFVLLPLVGAGLVWGVAGLLGRLPDPASDLGRLTALGLVLAGPATSVGAIMARAWWPRLVGVVVTSGLVAAVFVGRALFGP